MSNNSKQQYYYITLTWTKKDNRVITLWKPNHSGYAQILERAGLYDKPHDEKCNSVLSVNYPTLKGEASCFHEV